MDKRFFSERHKELYEKFDKLGDESVMVLGGASEEDARNFSLESYSATLNKNYGEYNGNDSKNIRLATKGLKGSRLYDKLDYNDKPFYCRVMDNCRNHKMPDKRPFEDPVYKALVDLEDNLSFIHDRVFESYPDDGTIDKEEREHLDAGSHGMHYGSRESFIRELINYFDTRGRSKGSSSRDKWGNATRVDESRYNLLLELLVESDSESRKEFEDSFVGAIPMFDYEGFYFWPEE
jgi:hypothetical protein